MMFQVKTQVGGLLPLHDLLQQHASLEVAHLQVQPSVPRSSRRMHGAFQWRPK